MPTITSSEIKYNIFDLETTDFHILLYSHLHNYFLTNIDTIGNNSILNFDNWLQTHNQCPLKIYTHRTITYNTLPTYIRNCIDHPDNNHCFTEQEFSKSLKYMINLIITNNYR